MAKKKLFWLNFLFKILTDNVHMTTFFHSFYVFYVQTKKKTTTTTNIIKVNFYSLRCPNNNKKMHITYKLYLFWVNIFFFSLSRWIWSWRRNKKWTKQIIWRSFFLKRYFFLLISSETYLIIKCVFFIVKLTTTKENLEIDLIIIEWVAKS